MFCSQCQSIASPAFITFHSFRQRSSLSHLCSHTLQFLGQGSLFNLGKVVSSFYIWRSQSHFHTPIWIIHVHLFLQFSLKIRRSLSYFHHFLIYLFLFKGHDSLILFTTVTSPDDTNAPWMYPCSFAEHPTCWVFVRADGCYRTSRSRKQHVLI